MYKELLNNYLIQNGFYKEITISNDEYAALSDEDKSKFKATHYDENSKFNSWVKKELVDLTEEQIAMIISMQSADELSDIKKDVHILTNIAVIFTALAVIGAILSILLLFF